MNKARGDGGKEMKEEALETEMVLFWSDYESSQYADVEERRPTGLKRLNGL